MGGGSSRRRGPAFAPKCSCRHSLRGASGCLVRARGFFEGGPVKKHDRNKSVDPRLARLVILIFCLALPSYADAGAHQLNGAEIVRRCNGIAIDASGLDHTANGPGVPVHTFGEQFGPTRATCDPAWTRRTTPSARISRIWRNLSGRDFARSADHRHRFAGYSGGQIRDPFADFM